MHQYFKTVPKRQRQWHIDNGVYSIPKCATCNQVYVNWSIKNKSYSKFCSSKCAHNHSSTRLKIQETCLAKYGATSNLKTEINKQKQRATLLEKYGVDNFSKTTEFKEKFKQTCLNKFGVDNPSKLEEVQNKIDQTHQLRYGRKRKSQIHIEQNIIDAKNNIDLMKEWYFDLKMPLTIIAERLGVNHSQLCVHFKENLGIDISRHRISYPEQEIFQFVKSFCTDAVQSDRLLIKPQELDIVIPSKKIAIEYNGLAWHGELRGKKPPNYHVDKMKSCREKGYNLIQIFSNEWEQNPDLVRARLLNKLGFAKKLPARKCQILTLDKENTNKFLEETHIQGPCVFKVSYGLIYQGQLVSVMTFGKPRFSRIAQWELLRFSTQLGLSVVGGASRLFNYFLKNNPVESVISYCDLRWNTGDVYKNLGFEYIKDTGPNYWYISKNRYLHNRMHFQKHKLPKILKNFDPAQTEWENMSAAGYDRIWDCGNSVWLWSSRS
ncbi:MAG: hypothetical protein N2235_05410 [Fischerella sp.]|nr:hypothetical protein [Fischerella sp.]